jgi:zinc transporter 9
MSLSQSQLRLISTIGMGVLVGTALIVVIPEGIEAVYTAELGGHTHGKRTAWVSETSNVQKWNRRSFPLHVEAHEEIPVLRVREASDADAFNALPGPVIPTTLAKVAKTTKGSTPTTRMDHAGTSAAEVMSPATEDHSSAHSPPTFLVGFSLILGFVLMFLIDKLPRHATETLQQPPPPRHISLNNLSQGLHETAAGATGDEESESFLQSLTPSPKQTRSLATTTGLVIHAAADGIAMGASATTSNTKLGFIIFIAIMIHKAPTAFGLTSVLLKQGLSKRAARGHLIIFSLAAPFGALCTWLLVQLLGGGGTVDDESGQWWTGILLLFSAGTFLFVKPHIHAKYSLLISSSYVAMHSMQEDGSGHDHPASNGYADGGSGSQRKHQRPQMRDTLAAVAGMLLPLLTQMGHHH